MRPGKVLCCMFLLVILGVDSAAQNLEKLQKVVLYVNTRDQQKHCDYEVYEHTKGCAGIVQHKS